MVFSVVKLGTIEYQQAYALQLKLQRLRQEAVIGDVLLLLEHPPVITVGTVGKETNIVASKEFLSAVGANVYRINRGGDVTYHGPGQLVGYPIFDLNNHGKDVKEYFRKLEETFINLLEEEYSIQANRDSQHPGIWVDDRKITAIGCSVKQMVTLHGFGFNVNTDLEHFKWINPCGITDKGVTSLQNLLSIPQDMELVTQQVIKHFSTVFDMEPILIEKEAFIQKLERGFVSS